MIAVPKVSTDFLDRINRKKFSKKIKRVILLPLVVLIIVMFCSGDYGLIKIYRLRTKIKTAEKEIDRLKVQAVDYNWKINKLKSDSMYIKLYASEIYGYGKADQTIIQFLPSPVDSLR